MIARECEVLVVGAGPAGIAAACCASESGRSVILADENPSSGGQIWRAETLVSKQGPGKEKPADVWFKRLARCGAAILSGATAFDADAGVGSVRFERERDVVEIRYKALVLATGARERFLPFPGWTLPGVYGAGGLQALVKGGFPVEGRRIVVAGTGPLLVAAAGMLGAHDADVVMILEQAGWRSMARFGLKLAAFPGKVREAIRLMHAAGIVPFRPGWWVCEAGGDGRVEWAAMTNGTRTVRLDCDLLACSYGLVPNSELARLLGCRTTYDERCPGAHAVEVDRRQRTSVEGVFACGEVTGIGGAELSQPRGVPPDTPRAVTGASFNACNRDAIATRNLLVRWTLRSPCVLNSETL